MKYYEISDKNRRKEYSAYGKREAKKIVKSIVLEHYAIYIGFNYIYKEKFLEKVPPMDYEEFYYHDELISISDGYDTVDRHELYDNLA